MESYCPLNKVTRKWSDRIKKVEEPLFKSYVFVRVCEDEKTQIRMTNGVVNFVYWLNKPAIVTDKEIETIRRFMNEHETVNAFPLQPQANQLVRIHSGVLMDKEARILRVRGSRVEVVIESMGYKLVANIKKSNIGNV